jgi:dihydroxyacetone kinase-like predicted kinase
MNEALAHIESGEITRAVRTTTVDGVAVQEGQLIGLHNGKLVVAGEDLKDVMTRLLKAMVKPRHEIVSLYRGADVSEQETAALIKALRTEFASLEIEQFEGGQPHYPYLLSVE